MSDDDGRDLTEELAEAIAFLADNNPGFVVLAAQIVGKMGRAGQLALLRGDITMFKRELDKQKPND
jgi:hypothetical protein